MKLQDINKSFARQMYFEAIKYADYVNETYLNEHKRLGVAWMGISHGHILINLYTDGEMTMTEITNRIGRKAPTTTVLVKRLKKEGYVSSRISEEDSRVSLILLTDKGRAHCENMESFLSDFCEAGEKSVTTEEVETVVRIFKKVRKNIELELNNED